jgi:hypothetical protein
MESLLGNIKEDNKVFKLLLFFEQTSQWLGVHRGTLPEFGGNNLHLKNTTHMHD